MKRYYLLLAGCFIAAGAMWFYSSIATRQQPVESPPLVVKRVSPALLDALNTAVAEPSHEVEFVYELTNRGSEPLRGLRAVLF